MASSSILPSLISWKGSSTWTSRKAAAAVGSSISISRKAAARSSICISRKDAAARSSFSISRKAATNLFSCSGVRIDTMSVISDDESSALCRSRSLPSKISPWLMLPPSFEGGDMVYQFYSLAENRVLSFNKRGRGGGGSEEEEELELELPDDEAEIVGSSHGWLASFNKRNYDLFLSNPLSGRHIKLPPIHSLPYIQVSSRRSWRVTKVIISCSPDEEECRAMMIFGQVDRLAFCLPGRSTEWTPIGALFNKFELPDSRFGRVYEDFVYSHRRKLFISMTEFDRYGWFRSPEFDVEGWDLGDPRCARINWVEEELILDSQNCPWSEEKLELLGLCREMQYLVFAEDSDELFIVTRYIRFDKSYDDDNFLYKTIGFDVLKVDREGGKLRYTSHGPVMFVGTNHSFAISAAHEFPELKPNSIYFTDANELLPPAWQAYGGSHNIGVGIFDYQNLTFFPCCYPQSIERNVNVPPPVWFTPSPYH